MRLLFVFFSLLIGCSSWAASLFIVIDDMGNNLSLGQRAVNLPSPINFAFLPHTPQAKSLANAAHQNGHGILLHAPMANIAHKELGPGGLLPSMEKSEMQAIFKASIQAIPHAQGFNNHMGSLLTQDPQAMNWLMEIAQAENLFFIDSLTSAKSVAAQQAEAMGVVNLTRDVFLDNQRSTQAIKQQFQRAIAVAEQKGHAVLIGHPYPETIEFLEQQLPILLPSHIRLRKLDEYLQPRIWQAFQLSPTQSSKFQLR